MAAARSKSQPSDKAEAINRELGSHHDSHFNLNFDHPQTNCTTESLFHTPDNTFIADREPPPYENHSPRISPSPSPSPSYAKMPGSADTAALRRAVTDRSTTGELFADALGSLFMNQCGILLCAVLFTLVLFLVLLAGWTYLAMAQEKM